jgi:hypothetical protein
MSVSIEGNFAERTAGLSLACENRGVPVDKGDKGVVQSRAVCSCGWCGGQHLMLAVHYAHLRSAQNRCRPAVAFPGRDLTARASAISSN